MALVLLYESIRAVAAAGLAAGAAAKMVDFGEDHVGAVVVEVFWLERAGRL